MGKTKSKVKKKKRRMDAARKENEETIKQLKKASDNLDK